MSDDRDLITRLIDACHEVLVRNADYLCDLDRAIGDGDHGTNMARGARAVLADRDHVAGLPFADAVSTVGMLLVMNVGGASGPLYGTLLLEFGKQLQNDNDWAGALRLAADAVARRGRSGPGDKTLLDVLYPVVTAVSDGADMTLLSQQAWQAAQMTANLKANRGRASYLGDRSVGHVDPGAASCALLASAICASLSSLSGAREAECA